MRLWGCRELKKKKKKKKIFSPTRVLVSTATIERTFSTIKIAKTRLRNKIDDGFLANSLVFYIERRIAESFDLDSILDNFILLRDCKVQF
jgi:hypothetical protein